MRRPRPPRLTWPPLRPAWRASSDVHSCAVPFWCAARPPLLAISRCFSGDIDAKPRRSLRSPFTRVPPSAAKAGWPPAPLTVTARRSPRSLAMSDPFFSGGGGSSTGVGGGSSGGVFRRIGRLVRRLPVDSRLWLPVLLTAVTTARVFRCPLTEAIFPGSNAGQHQQLLTTQLIKSHATARLGSSSARQHKSMKERLLREGASRALRLTLKRFSTVLSGFHGFLIRPISAEHGLRAGEGR